MKSYDPIAALQRLGYTEREAAFVALVANHSGYFLRRQYLTAIQRDDGALAQRFLQKLVSREHARAIEYAAGRHVYHLKAKQVYRIVEQEDSQNRRDKSDSEIKHRLMMLDYILAHPARKFFENERAKVKYFCDHMNVAHDRLPQREDGRCFVDRTLISLVKLSDGRQRTSFAFIDDGQRSISALERWLEKYAPLLRSLMHSEIVFVCDTMRNADAAHRTFLRIIPQNCGVTMRGYLLEYDYPIWSIKYRRAVL